MTGELIPLPPVTGGLTLSTTAAISPRVAAEVFPLHMPDIWAQRTKVWPGIKEQSIGTRYALLKAMVDIVTPPMEKQGDQRTRKCTGCRTDVQTHNVQLPILIWLTREHSYT